MQKVTSVILATVIGLVAFPVCGHAESDRASFFASICGNGTIETGEICDGGDACTAYCLPTASCPPDPIVGCSGRSAGRSKIKIRDADAKSSQQPLHCKDWAKFRTVGEPSNAEPGDPTTTDDVSFCFYDDAGLVFGADIEAGDPGWQCNSSTPHKVVCKYKKTDGNSFGITRGKIMVGPAGSYAQVSIKRDPFAAPRLPLAETGVATAQMTTSAGMCQEAVFAPPFRTNDAVRGVFQATFGKGHEAF